MEWKESFDGKIQVFKSFPYQIEKARYKYKLYRCVHRGNIWTMSLIGRYTELEDAKTAAENDKNQQTLWG